MTETRRVKAERIRDAREYAGFTVAEVADVLGCEPAEVERIEAGAATITGEQLRKIMRMYRRPLEWLTGESRFEPGPDLLRMTENLCEHDRSAVLEFAEFLQGAGKPPKITRADLEKHDA